MSGGLFHVEIDTSNAAFEDYNPGELARILRVAAGKVADGALSGSLHDSNGNGVGTFWQDDAE